MQLSQKVPIDYAMLAEAVTYYKSLGYTQIEVPWIVEKDVSMQTCPHENNAFKLDGGNKHLIGSAEQGFIQILKLNPNLLDYDKFYFSVSPCFRYETQDELHSLWFMKLELFLKRRPESCHLLSHLHLMDAARRLFNKLINDKVTYYLRRDNLKYDDIVYNGIELGSYGKRDYNGIDFLYGTGLALPRMSIAISSKIT